MKRLSLLLVLLAVGCSKKEDAPPPYTPHVAGMWVGSGQNDAIGYYTWSMTLTQSGNSAAGTYDTASALTTTHGNVLIQFGPQGGNNVQSLTMTQTTFAPTSPAPSRTCSGTVMNLSQPTFITGSALSFYYNFTDCFGYTAGGGANLHKTIATN
jgi:hypothetical protein